jgi:hypothetical protein
VVSQSDITAAPVAAFVCVIMNAFRSMHLAMLGNLCTISGERQTLGKKNRLLNEE